VAHLVVFWPTESRWWRVYPDIRVTTTSHKTLTGAELHRLAFFFLTLTKHAMLIFNLFFSLVRLAVSFFFLFFFRLELRCCQLTLISITQVGVLSRRNRHSFHRRLCSILPTR
jgi:hypothetical protein